MSVVVVGGGILGRSAAYHLACQGVAVTVVDRADAGRATAAGAGIVCPWGSRTAAPSTYALLAAGARYYPDLLAALAADGERETGYERVGGLFVSDDPADLDATERLVRQRGADAPGSIERLDPAEARRLFPPLRPDLAALHVAGGARVDGRLLTAALRRAAEHRGARSVAGSAELRLSGDRVAGVRVGDETIEADAVLVTAGAWAPALLEPLGLRLAVAPERGQIIHLHSPGVDTRGWPAIEPLNSYYLLAFDDSRVVIGATREAGTGFDHRLTAVGIAEVLNAGLAVAPGLAGWTLHETRIGFRPVSAGSRPLLGPVPGLDNLLIGNGLGSGGLTMGPLAGKLLAQAALGQATTLPLDDYEPFGDPSSPIS